MKEFDIEKLERKNIYKVPDNLFENIQDRVMYDVKASEKTPVFKLNWVYAVAASLALVFGVTFVLNSENETPKDLVNSKSIYTINNQASKTESEVAYETLKSDLTSVESNNQKVDNQENKKSFYAQENDKKEEKTTLQTDKPISKEEEAQMNEYLDSFSNSEISELANNSTQDVYLDLYN